MNEDDQLEALQTLCHIQNEITSIEMRLAAMPIEIQTQWPCQDALRFLGQSRQSVDNLVLALSKKSD